MLTISNGLPCIDVPKDSMIDETINIQVRNLPDSAEITIQATYIAPDQVKWVSSATYKAIQNGVVSLASQAPLSGSYQGVNPMGLFFSMAPIPREQNLSHFNFASQTISLEVLKGAEKIAESTIVRRILSPNVARKEIRENGLIGTLFTPNGTGPFPGVIVIPGAQGGISENHAALLASHGFVAFALAYHGLEGLSPWVFNIPVEYFQKGFAFLKAQDKVNKEALGFVGNSKGAELVIFYASTFPDDLKALVAYVPLSVATNFTDSPCWLQGGKPIQPHFPFQFTPPDKQMKRGSFDNPISATEKMNDEISNQPEQFEAATIKVENLKAPLLLFSGLDDQTIPSTFFANKIIERLDNTHSTIERTHVAYENAGHPIGFPLLPNLPANSLPFNLGKWWGSGGTVAGNAFAATDSFAKSIQFLDKHLKGKQLN